MAKWLRNPEKPESVRDSCIGEVSGENFERKLFIANFKFAFSALTLLVGHQEEHLACKEFQ